MAERAVSPGAAIRVLLVDDHTPVREALSALLTGCDGVDLVGAFGSAEALVEALEAGVRADVVLVDLDLPRASGQWLIAHVRRTAPELEPVVLTSFDDGEHLFSALRAGAAGYLLKDTPPDELVRGLEQVVAGGAPMSPSIARRVLQEFTASPDAHAESLTPREVDVVQLLVRGATYRRIGDALGIATGTVQSHIKAIYRKLDVTTKAGAALEAHRRGLLGRDD